MREIRDIILSSKTLILLIFCFFLFCDLYYQSNQKKTFLLTDFYKFNNLFIEETDLDLYTTVKEILDSEEFLRRSFSPFYEGDEEMNLRKIINFYRLNDEGTYNQALGDKKIDINSSEFFTNNQALFVIFLEWHDIDEGEIIIQSIIKNINDQISELNVKLIKKDYLIKVSGIKPRYSLFKPKTVLIHALFLFQFLFFSFLLILSRYIYQVNRDD